MTWFSGFLWLRPLWLLALPAVVVFGVIAARRARGLAGWENAVDPVMMAALSRIGAIVPGDGRRALWPAVIAAVLALALAGPAIRDRNPPTFRNLDGVVVAVDLSRSIVEGGSLDDAKAAVQYVLQRAGSRPSALVVYAGEAYLASAFTSDPHALGSTVSLLSGDLVPNPGSRTDRALALAGRTLAQANMKNGDVVLVTDGDQVSPGAMRQVQALKDDGAHVSAIFVAPTISPGDMPAPQPDALKRLAAMGDGFFASASDPSPVADGVGERTAGRLAAGDLAVLLFTDYGRYLCALALIPALALFRRSI